MLYVCSVFSDCRKFSPVWNLQYNRDIVFTCRGLNLIAYTHVIKDCEGYVCSRKANEEGCMEEHASLTLYCFSHHYSKISTTMV